MWDLLPAGAAPKGSKGEGDISKSCGSTALQAPLCPPSVRHERGLQQGTHVHPTQCPCERLFHTWCHRLSFRNALLRHQSIL